MTTQPATTYQFCPCCGQKLAPIIQETIPGKPRLLVTCWTKDTGSGDKCPMEGKTLSPAEHAAAAAVVWLPAAG